MKGRGMIPTYFVCVDDDMEFVKATHDDMSLADGDLSMNTKL